jgi:transposase
MDLQPLPTWAAFINPSNQDAQRSGRIRHNDHNGAVIPNPSDQPRQATFDRVAYAERHRVERTVGRRKQFRRVATR